MKTTDEHWTTEESKEAGKLFISMAQEIAEENDYEDVKTMLTEWWLPLITTKKTNKRKRELLADNILEYHAHYLMQLMPPSEDDDYDFEMKESIIYSQKMYIREILTGK